MLEIAKEQGDFLDSYKIFKGTRKQLAAIDPDLIEKFNVCLKVMSHFNLDFFN